MSASLVGSEMCIRDRPPTAPGADACAERACSTRGSDGATREPTGDSESCLLYTSDAADDM
eukprot:13830914-Alexandrium_andersonii.AAC.1